jgi:hypothetical protein
MKRSGPEYCTIRFNSIIWFLVFIIGLMVFKKDDYYKTDYRHQTDPVEISVIHSKATVSSGIQYYHVQKIWIPNKGNFRLLTFDQTKLLDNNKADRKILILDKTRKNSIGFLIPLIHFKLLPKESDEIPILS